MKKSWIIIIIVIIALIIIVVSLQRPYNKMVTMDEKINGSWAQVESDYQRRADLIPNLVSTVQGYADFEKQTLTDVVNARSKATAVNINPENLNAESLKQFQQAQDGLSSALARLMVVVEKYPDLKANQNFLDLQSQLEGTENRIATARRYFNTAVQDYNSYIRRFPQVIYASMFGFDKKGYFESTQGAEKAPEVKF